MYLAYHSLMQLHTDYAKTVWVIIMVLYRYPVGTQLNRHSFVNM